MKEIFISYSSIDTVSAEAVRNVLERNGLSCWMAPRDIPGGSNYTKEIPGAIRNCKAFVLILSENAQNSHWVLKELDSAVNCGKVILPFMVEDCALNDEFNFLLTGAQRYAAYQKKAEALEILIGRIRSILDTSESVASEESAPQQSAEPEREPAVQKEAVHKKTPVVYFTDAVCPACGSSELTLLPRRLKRRGINELATLVYIPLMGIACYWVFLFLSAILLPYNQFELAAILSFICFIGGCIWGNVISKKAVRRSRIRRHIRVTCYRCKTCDKVFRYDEPVEQ